MNEIRLDRFICNKTQISRNEIKLLFKNGLISVDGKVEKDGARKILPEECCVLCKGKTLTSSRFSYIIDTTP